jgi:hypothetical protein
MMPDNQKETQMPFANGVTIAGYGVVRNAPWHVAGIYGTEAEANFKAAELGLDYQVHYGENREGTDDFIWGETSTG